MDNELELTKANRLKVARAFRHNKRVDFSIDCVIEGQLGRVLVDDPARPAAYRLTVGPFSYFAGAARSAGGLQLVQAVPVYHIIMPSPPDWHEAIGEVYGGNLNSFSRYTLSAAGLSADHLNQLLAGPAGRHTVVALSAELAGSVASQPGTFLDLSEFDSPADFVERGIGFVALDRERVAGVAYSSLVCSQGIEVSIFVDEAYRRQGVATALASQLLLESLRPGLRPNWDAANTESVELAKKLGYVFVEAYEAYYHTKK